MRPLRHPLLALLMLAAPAAHAEIYKWVDEQGRTHYGERKPGAHPAAATVKIQPSASPPPPAPTQPATSENWLRKPPKPVAKAPVQPTEPPRRSRSGGVEDGTDASRCNLARDILDGNLRHSNGAPIDRHDIETAKSDVKLFCKSR